MAGSISLGDRLMLDAADGPLKSVRRIAGPRFAMRFGAIGDRFPAGGANFGRADNHGPINMRPIIDMSAIDAQDMGVSGAGDDIRRRAGGIEQKNQRGKARSHKKIR